MQGARGVIINVTGGHDMSLMEVNEASLLIQEAAHEDANIIFGAVVDPNLDGRVKVTVIATGFDTARRGRRRPSASHTPVDLQHYTAHLKERQDFRGSAGDGHRPVVDCEKAGAGSGCCQQRHLHRRLEASCRPSMQAMSISRRCRRSMCRRSFVAKGRVVN